MKILYVTCEAAPYAASGGLGAVMGSLSSEVAKCGHEVAVILPLYAQVAAAHRAKMQKLTEFTLPYAWRESYCGVYRLSENGVDYYFIDNEQYFKRPTMYGQYDDGERYAYFCHAVIEFMLHEGYIPDVLHANDWQAALSVVYLKLRYSMCQELRGIKTVFTIHNIEYQGRYGMHSLGDIFDIGFENASIMEYHGDINLLKAAVVLADRVTTVSPNYAKELADPYFAYGMEHVIRAEEGKMSGIINGIDTDYFNSLKDDIPYAFSTENAKEGKEKNKAHLQEALGLPVSADTPLVAMITRLTEGKGVDLVLHVFEELMEENVQFVLLGTGDARYEQIFASIASRYGDRARALIKFDRALSKEIYAAADIFLMPSKTEPCGLAQMIACRYGTVPVVHGVGGLADSIIPYGEAGGNGFVFRNFNAHDMFFRLKEALALYHDEEAWAALRQSAMQSDFTWKASAEKYIELYQF
jgi:starch synthase